MWICLNNAFYSIVNYSEGKGPNLLVRARFKGDINRTFPEVEEKHLPGRDYAWRAEVSRERVAKAMHDAVMNINYPNFKDSVEENWRHDVYAELWSVLYNAQHRRRYNTVIDK